MAKRNINIYITVADTERLAKLGIDPREFAKAAVKQALLDLDDRRAEALADTMRPSPFLDLPPLTDEENQRLEESRTTIGAETVFVDVPTPKPLSGWGHGPRVNSIVIDEITQTEIPDDWLARLRKRAAGE